MQNKFNLSICRFLPCLELKYQEIVQGILTGVEKWRNEVKLYLRYLLFVSGHRELGF